MPNFILRVGPHGYIHGWIFVGAQGIGGRVFHPHHGHGSITAHDGKRTSVAFDKGHTADFESARDKTAAGDFKAPGGKDAHSVTAKVATEAKVIPPGEIDSWAAKHFTPTKKLTKVQQDAVNEYSGGGYVPINAHLRGQEVKHLSSHYTPERVKGYTAALDRVMANNRVPEDLTVSRGSTLKAFGGLPPKVGSVYQDPGYLSTSVLDTPPGDAHADYEVQMHINIPKGTPGYYLGAASAFPSERELLLGKGLKLVVTKAQRRDGVWHVTAEVVQDA